MVCNEDDITCRLRGAGQDHLAEILERGSDADKAALRQQLTTELFGVDFSHLNDVLRHSLQAVREVDRAEDIEPPPKDALFDVTAECQTDRSVHLRNLGYEAIHAGHLAFLILAGGSGTRLGVDVPKGLFTCHGLHQKKSLFQFHCEKIRRREELATAHCGGVPSARIQLLVMTSAQNDAQTRQFFSERNYFGLAKTQVHFFQQLSLPCYDETTGKILMESSNRMCLAPGGNGGVFQALASVPQGGKESVLQRIQRLGVTYVQIGSVDNILSKVADPLFVGYAVKEQAHVVVKTTRKTSPEESVGVFARVNGEWGVVEYTEIGKRAKELDPVTGDLKFNCANIAAHLCSVRFLQLAADRIKSFTRYHIARKKISTVNGDVIGVKLEAFIFDLFRFAKECVDSSEGEDGFRIMQVDRSEEFAPIKNADGALSDTPTEAARLLLALHTRWMTAALATAAAGESEEARRAGAALSLLQRCRTLAEISPLVSSDGDGLLPHIPRVVGQLLGGACERVLLLHPDELSSESPKM